MRKHFIYILMLIMLASFITAESSSISNYSCSIPLCEGAYDTGKTDENGCKIYTCPSTTNSSVIDSESCLDDPTTYWDQETDQCYEGFSKDIIAKLCSDPDGGINKYLIAHTFGFRSTFADSRDQRIRTGGKDSCISENQLVEHYCDESGYIQTTYLDCPGGCKDGVCIKSTEIKEQITCMFKGSNTENTCYLAGQWTDADQGTKWCKGTESCSINFAGSQWEKIVWKSSCGGYQYTFQDGKEETIYFDCAQGETTSTEVLGDWFKKAYWQCYDGTESYEGGETSCKPGIVWKKYAAEFCEGHCSKDTGKCGVNSYMVTSYCYVEGEKPIIISTEGSSDVDCEEYLDACKKGGKAACEKWQMNCQVREDEIESIDSEEVLVCKDACPLDGKCYPFGYRKEGNFCSDKGKFVTQLKGEEKCENNFECGSNVCVSGECISQGMIEKILNWFKKIFS